MADEINVQAVIEQLMNRIAQLELEVAVLKAMTTGLPPTEVKIDAVKPDKSDGGYV